jgi:ech hydrogenase subunit D
MLTDVKEINSDQLHGEVLAMRRQGSRLVTITCTDLGDAHDLLYHFDKQYQLCHLRMRVPRGTVVPSISSTFFAATLVENEMKDLFGLAFEGLAIDYQGRFLMSEGAPSTPLNKTGGMPVEVIVRAPAAAAGGTP